MAFQNIGPLPSSPPWERPEGSLTLVLSRGTHGPRSGHGSSQHPLLLNAAPLIILRVIPGFLLHLNTLLRVSQITVGEGGWLLALCLYRVKSLTINSSLICHIFSDLYGPSLFFLSVNCLKGNGT